MQWRVMPVFLAVPGDCPVRHVWAGPVLPLPAGALGFTLVSELNQRNTLLLQLLVPGRGEVGRPKESLGGLSPESRG